MKAWNEWRWKMGKVGNAETGSWANAQRRKKREKEPANFSITLNPRTKVLSTHRWQFIIILQVSCTCLRRLPVCPFATPPPLLLLLVHVSKTFCHHYHILYTYLKLLSCAAPTGVKHMRRDKQPANPAYAQLSCLHRKFPWMEAGATYEL